MEMEYMLLLMSQLRTMGLAADQIDKVLPGLVQALEAITSPSGWEPSGDATTKL